MNDPRKYSERKIYGDSFLSVIASFFTVFFNGFSQLFKALALFKMRECAEKSAVTSVKLVGKGKPRLAYLLTLTDKLRFQLIGAFFNKFGAGSCHMFKFEPEFFGFCGKLLQLCNAFVQVYHGNKGRCKVYSE